MKDWKSSLERLVTKHIGINLKRCIMDKRKIRKFKRICNELAELMEEMHEIDPDIMLFVAGESSTSAMLIDTKGNGFEWWRKHQPECVLADVKIPHADCGGI